MLEKMQQFQRTIALFNKELQEVGDVVVMELELKGFLREIQRLEQENSNLVLDKR